jgi:hypothetical protein
MSLMAAQAQAGNPVVTIDGVTIEPGSQFWVSTLFENQLSSVTDTLYGVGYVNTVNGPSGPSWSNGNNGTQLAYYFSGYTVSAWYSCATPACSTYVAHTGADNTGFTTTAVAINFTGGSVNFYADAANTLNPYSSSGPAADIAAATSGTLWASYVGQPFDFSGSQGVQSGGTLYATNGATNANLGGTGLGYLDVTGGAAYNNLHTQAFTNLTNGGSPTTADAQLFSTYTNTNPVGLWPLSGSANLKTTAVPEPATLALFGAGLVGIGAVARKRKQG